MASADGHLCCGGVETPVDFEACFAGSNGASRTSLLLSL